MFGTKRVVGRQPYASAAFILGEIPGTHFQRLSRPQGTWFRRKPLKKMPSDGTGNRSRDLPTSSAVRRKLSALFIMEFLKFVLFSSIPF